MGLRRWDNGLAPTAGDVSAAPGSQPVALRARPPEGSVRRVVSSPVPAEASARLPGAILRPSPQWASATRRACGPPHPRELSRALGFRRRGPSFRRTCRSGLGVAHVVDVAIAVLDRSGSDFCHGWVSPLCRLEGESARWLRGQGGPEEWWSPVMLQRWEIALTSHGVEGRCSLARL